MSKAGVLSIEKAVDTLIYNYPGQTIKQSLKTDSVLIVIWDGRYKYRFLLDRSKSLEIYGLDEKVKMYQIDAEIDGLDYWIDGYGLVATNPFGYPVFYDRGNTMAEVAIKALINDTTRFFTIMLPEEDTINIARIDSIRRRSE